jgi:hypothetical protein
MRNKWHASMYSRLAASHAAARTVRSLTAPLLLDSTLRTKGGARVAAQEKQKRGAGCMRRAGAMLLSGTLGLRFPAPDSLGRPLNSARWGLRCRLGVRNNHPSCAPAIRWPNTDSAYRSASIASNYG